eukprot:3305577-Rhodomonas_salina.4
MKKKKPSRQMRACWTQVGYQERFLECLEIGPDDPPDSIHEVRSGTASLVRDIGHDGCGGR